MAKGKVIQTVWELKDKLSGGIKNMQKNTLQYRRDLRDLKKVGADAFKTIAKGVAGVSVATVGLAGAGVLMSNKFSNVADEIDKASYRAGVSTTYLQEMRYAMGQVGVSSDVLDRLLKRTNQRMGMAAAGNKGYTSALNEMGVAIKDTSGNLRSAEDVFQDAVDSLSRMENAQDQARLAGQFFGVMAAQNLLPAIAAGGDEIKKLREEAHHLGAVIDEDAIQAGLLWGDSMDRVKKAMGGVFNTIAASTLPHFNKGIVWLVDKIPTVRTNIVNTFQAIESAIENTREKFSGIRVVMVDIKNSIMSAFGSGGDGGNAIEWFTGTAIPGVVDGIAKVFDEVAKTYFFIKDNWSLIAPVVYGVVGALTAYHVITKSIIIAKHAWTAAQWALNVALNANPIGIIITGIGLLIAAGVFLIKNWDDVKLAGQNTWNSMVTGAEWMANKVVSGINWMVEKSLTPINKMIAGLNKIPGVDIKPVEFAGISQVDLGSRKFDTEGKEYAWGKKKEEESFEDILAQYDKQQEIKVQQQQASYDNLIDALDENTETMKGTAGRVNDIHVTLYASEMTAEEIADKLVPKIKHKLFA